jgi:hypothetical protein
MIMWEYENLEDADLDSLNALGKDGWEVVSVLWREDRNDDLSHLE